MRVAIVGGSGFVGGYLVEALVEAGHDLSLLVRSGSESKLRRAEAGRIVEGDVASATAIAETVRECDAVIYNVGILRELPSSGITFEELQYRGVVRVAGAARDAGVSRFLLMSANGVKQPGTPYQETKYRAEDYVRRSGLDYTIFRPSVIFGDPQGAMEIATQLYRDMIAPPLPGIGFHTGLRPSAGKVLMSPVHVQDVAAAFAGALDNAATIGRTYTLGGPETLSWNDMLRRIATAVGKHKLILPMPIAVMRVAAGLFDWLPFFPVTRDQLTMLAEGNTADPGELEALTGRPPRAFEAENLRYLSGAPKP